MYNQIILLGVVVSMIFTEITGLSAGLIVPGYLVLALHSPCLLYTSRTAFQDTVGKVSAEFVYLYPPGIPIIAPGEVFTDAIVERCV